MKTILNIIFFTLLVNVVSAQQSDTTMPYMNGRTSFGIKGGFTQANFYGSDVNFLSANGNTKPVIGFHIGITANSMISKSFWLKHELLMTQKGAGIMLNDSINGNYTTKIKTLSLDLFPISPTCHYKGFQVYCGPYVSMLMNAKVQKKDDSGNFYTDKSIFGDGKQFENKSKYMQKFDFGFTAGIEYEFKFGLSIGAKYVRGFAEVIQYANSNTFNDPKHGYKIYNQYFNISVGYSFGKHER